MGKKDKQKKKQKEKDKKKRKKKKDVTSILDHIQPSFVEDGARSITSADLAEVLGAREELIKRFDPEQTLGRFREEATLMLSLLDDYARGRYVGLSYWSVSVIVFAFHYVLKPVDIIPDNLPVIGQLDDSDQGVAQRALLAVAGVVALHPHRHLGLQGDDVGDYAVDKVHVMGDDEEARA